MNILFFSHYYPPEVNAPATRTYEHCVRWARAGHDVTVVTCAPNCPDGVVYEGYRNRWRRQIEEIDGVRVIRVWTYVAPNAGTVRRIANYLSYMASAVWASLRIGKPDVIVATSPQFFCGWAGVLASRLKRVPFVLEIRDIWPESIAAVGAIRNRTILHVLEWLERRMYLAADRIVAVGEGYKKQIETKVDMEGRIDVITNGVDLKAFVPGQPDPEFLKRWGLEGKFVCSYIGTIGMAHGLEVVVKAAKLLRESGRHDVVFCLVGDGANRERLQREVNEKGLGDWVVFTGRRPKHEMAGILASSDACLIHLRGCNLFGTVLPSKIFETMAMGRPIIMGVRGEACDVVLEADAGVEMEPDSAESLVQRIEALAEDPEAARRHGTAARHYVAEHFNRDVLAERFLRLLRHLVENGRDAHSAKRASGVVEAESSEPLEMAPMNLAEAESDS